MKLPLNFSFCCILPEAMHSTLYVDGCMNGWNRGVNSSECVSVPHLFKSHWHPRQREDRRIVQSAIEVNVRTNTYLNGQLLQMQFLTIANFSFNLHFPVPVSYAECETQSQMHSYSAAAAAAASSLPLHSNWVTIPVE